MYSADVEAAGVAVELQGEVGLEGGDVAARVDQRLEVGEGAGDRGEVDGRPLRREVDFGDSLRHTGVELVGEVADRLRALRHGLRGQWVREATGVLAGIEVLQGQGFRPVGGGVGLVPGQVGGDDEPRHGEPGQQRVAQSSGSCAMCRR